MKKIKKETTTSEENWGNPMATRPTGIAILSILLLIIGAIVLLGGVVLLAFSSIIASTPRAAEEVARNLSQLPGLPFGVHRLVAAELIMVFISIFIIIIGIIMAVIGWGLWTDANWARWIAIIFFGWGALTSLLNLFQGQLGSIINLAINGLIVYYLFLQHVKRFFSASV